MSAPAFTENWYPDEQAAALAAVYGRVRGLDGLVVEVGCWEGKSSIALANACRPDALVCVDTWAGSPHDDSAALAAGRDVFARFAANMAAGTAGNFTVAREDCFAWLARLAVPVKFLHLDADHHYESVARALALALPRLVPGGVICGDDFRNAHAGRADLGGGVERAVRERCPGFELAAHGNLWIWQRPA